VAEAVVQVERQGAVATLWLNRPQQRNAFDEVLIDSLTVALRQLDEDDTVRVVVLAGRGPAFCAGADLDWMRRMAGQDEAANLADAARLAVLLQTLARLGKPSVARVQGAALGGGTGLVAACDIAIAASDAVFGTTEVRLGLIPATISPYVLAAIGPRAARRYFLSGERIDAATALRFGLVHEACANEVLDARVAELVAHLLAGAPGAQRSAKRLVADYVGRPIDAALVEDSSRRIAAARVTEEAREGIEAFFARRKPRWSE
jgi:methylglutaconyl-CoA hydratase